MNDIMKKVSEEKIFIFIKGFFSKKKCMYMLMYRVFCTKYGIYRVASENILKR